MKLSTLIAAAISCFVPVAVYAGSVTTLDPACQPGTLQSYLDLSSQRVPGCSIGFLNFDQFTFFASSGSPDTATDIFLTPAVNGFSITQVSGAFTGPAEYQIGYDFVIDPAPVLDGADLSLDPPSGMVTITQYYCNDADLKTTQGPNGGAIVTCTGNNPTPQSLQVTVAAPVAATTFDPPARANGSVLTDILIGPNSGFDGVTGNASVTGSPTTPEPATFAMVGLGLGLVAWKRRDRLSRVSTARK